MRKSQLVVHFSMAHLSTANLSFHTDLVCCLELQRAEHIIDADPILAFKYELARPTLEGAPDGFHFIVSLSLSHK